MSRAKKTNLHNKPQKETRKETPKQAAERLRKQQEKTRKTLIYSISAAAVVVLALVVVLVLNAIPNLHHVEIDVEGYGTIKLELNADEAPITVKNFIKLAKSGFYDGLTFHRVVPGFLIQGGSPDGTSLAKGSESITGEFYANGIPNDIKHERGVISMARSQDYNSASCQFFIVQKETPSLDGHYAAFGHVTEGMEIVDLICANTPVVDDNGTVLAEDQPVITAVRVID